MTPSPSSPLPSLPSTLRRERTADHRSLALALLLLGLGGWFVRSVATPAPHGAQPARGGEVLAASR